MIIYRIEKNNLSDKDFKFVKSIQYDNDKLIIISIKPRNKPGEERKKFIITVPASEPNWKFFKKKYFNENNNSQINSNI